MKHKIALSVSVFIFILVIFWPNMVLGANDYTIESYNINMIVNEDNTFDITETIDVNFSTSKHGIYRKIPLRNTIKRLDGTRSSNIAKITNIEVSESYTTSSKDGYKIIKIGDANNTFKGKKSYTIKYTYNIGKDPLKSEDELYFNLIGEEWDTSISNVNFTIIMPKRFDKTKLGFSSGYKSTTNSLNVSYTVIGNKIEGSLNNTLYSGNAITVRLSLPEGYFVGASNNLDYVMIVQIAVSILFVIISYNLWKKHGKDDMTVETVEFYPPNDLNSAEIAFLYKGHSDQKDIVSLLIYLANKKYLRIEEDEKKTFKIIKVKEYDGYNENERIFFDGLFKEKNEVTKSDLYNKFYVTLNKIIMNINKKDNQEKVFEKASLGKRIFVMTMIIIVFLFMKGLSIIKLGNIYAIMLVLFMLGWPLLLVYSESKTSTIILTSFVFLVVTFFCMFTDIFVDKTYLIKYIIESVCMVSLIVFLGIMKKRTRYGNEMLGRIQGFRNFLEMAEKPQLEELVMEDPEYFYNILPYTYVLGISNKWMKKFEDIAIQEPNWYYGYSNFSTRSFNRFVNSTYSSISTAMSSSPSSSSSGGGFLGGGSGGGGGGSW